MPRKRLQRKKTSVRGIWQEGPDRFLVRARWIDSKTGKEMKAEGLATTFPEAVVLKDTLKNRGDTAQAKPGRTRLGAYAEQWLEEHAEELAPSTRDRYATELAHAVTGLGEHFLDAIDEHDVLRWRNGMLKAGARPTVNGRLRVLRRLLDQAQHAGLLARNPARLVKELSVSRTGGRRGCALQAAEFERVLKAIKCLSAERKIAADVGRMLLTLAWTGMRRGELFALKWVDIEEREIHVTRSVWRGLEKSTKTDDPRRVPIPEPLAEVVAEQRRWLMETQQPGLVSGLVFPASARRAAQAAARRGSDEVSWYRSMSVLDEPLKAVVARAGVPEISLHSFRRTYENLLRAAGVDELVRRSLAGWRTEKAQEIYAGVHPNERAQAAKRMVDLVFAKGEP